MNTLPKVAYNSSIKLDIEVMTFDEMHQKLTKTNNHNPFLPHKIQFYIILVITEGNYDHFVDFKFYNLKKGDILFIAKNQVHHFTENFKETAGFAIILNSDFLEQNYFLSKSVNLNRLYNYHLETPVLEIDESLENNFINIVQNLYSEYQQENDFAKNEMLRSYLHIFLLKSERIKEQLSEKNIKNRWLDVFNQFKNLLEKEYVKTRSSRFYADKLFVSYKFLNDVVKQLTSKTVKAFIDDFVTTEIKRYLLSTSLSIKEISYKTGFEEPANMIKFFKKNAKITPFKFRQKN
ncbi:hypothetical protein BW723_14855 [Polaribacter reichenbachii]|uniref:HTH araC/xylS-type domain-containing protein n=1 Tax=Polaribacter reichenbachii TaxID=996801 RepID=A0A1B8U4D0_9FLAO|nr:helix-turn-helix transcriptional regulator [Polaribacter reichenbachii]APZ47485.1 hypothetical protein BW723_14855 [Polaribacter reichenbachii]AUC18124.1 hypothetical protein BTO17_05295 [Polaribacter reichenbachii]OBY66735.1 hypothetical protein LPB301_05925 [Polaribacter reichenbachii]